MNYPFLIGYRHAFYFYLFSIFLLKLLHRHAPVPYPFQTHSGYDGYLFSPHTFFESHYPNDSFF